MSALVYVNGDLVPKLSARLSVYDHGLLYGDGVWEGMRLRNGDIPYLDLHLTHLDAAVKAMALPLSLSRDELAAVIRSAIAANARQSGYVRVVMTRGPGTIGLDPRKCDPCIIVLVDDVVPFPAELYAHGLHVITSGIRFDPSNPLHRIRSLSHGHMTLAKAEALRAGCLDAILLTPSDLVAGTCEGHLFRVKEHAIQMANAGLPADVAANLVHEIAVRQGVPWESASLTIADLQETDEVFLAGTTGGVIGIVRLDGRDLGSGTEGPVTRAIRTAYREMLS